MAPAKVLSLFGMPPRLLNSYEGGHIVEEASILVILGVG